MLITSCSHFKKEDGKVNAEIAFTENEHNFGEIEQGGNGTYEFEFKNTGTDPLIINSVQATCGCTTPKWTNEPVNENSTGKISVKYNTQIIGKFTKTIRVYSNAKTPTVVLKIKGVVKPKAAAAKN
jgi:hypothetical protein